MDWLSSFEWHWLRPWWGLAALPALALAAWLWHRRSPATVWEAVIEAPLLAALLDTPPAHQRRWPLALLLAAWLLAVFALMGPSWSRQDHPALKPSDALVILLDLSPSMLARDVPPSRLQAAHYKILDLLKQRREGYTGLVAYAGSAHVVAPLSDDSNTLAALVTTLEPSVMPSVGSATEAAVAEGLALLHNSHFTEGRLLLVTDGVVPAAVERIREHLHGHPVELHVIGVGTPAGGPIQLSDGTYLKDDSGKVQNFPLERAPLQALASAHGGRYSDLRTDHNDIAPLTGPANALAALTGDGAREASHRIEHWLDSGYWLVLPCLLVALAAFRRGLLACLLPAVCLLAMPLPVRAADNAAETAAPAFRWIDLWQTPDQQAQAALEAGDAARAAQLFRHPAWKAYAEYQNHEHAAAAEHLAALDDATSHYNRGNALARDGQLQEAINAYDAALTRQPDFPDAQANRDLVARLLQQQQKQQQQQQKNSSSKDSQQQDGESQDSQQQQEQQQEQAPQSGQPQPQDGSTPQEGQPSEQASPPPPDAAPQASQQPPNEQAGQQPQANGQAGEASPEQPQEANAEQDKPAEDPGENPEKQQSAQAEAADPTDQPASDAESRARAEQQRMVDQWLRTVPDDPGGLLRNKFEYYYRQNRQQEIRDLRAGKISEEEQRW